jgi:hypothetical protein
LNICPAPFSNVSRTFDFLICFQRPEKGMATQAEFAKAFGTNALAKVRDKKRRTWNQ